MGVADYQRCDLSASFALGKNGQMWRGNRIWQDQKLLIQGGNLAFGFVGKPSHDECSANYILTIKGLGYCQREYNYLANHTTLSVGETKMSNVKHRKDIIIETMRKEKECY